MAGSSREPTRSLAEASSASREASLSEEEACLEEGEEGEERRQAEQKSQVSFHGSNAEGGLARVIPNT
jgi:hypothetical protein